MAFQYYGANESQPMGLDYSIMQPQPQPQQQQQQQSQMDPSMIMGMLEKFGVGGGGGGEGAASLAGEAGPGGASTLSGASAGGSGASAGGSGASGGMMSGLASNPWAWLAAVIVGNELYANKRGYRREGTDYWKDLFSGEVMHQDIEKRFLPKLGIDEGSKTSKIISHLIQPISADLGESWDRFKDIF